MNSENGKLRALLQQALDMLEEQALHIEAEVQPAGKKLLNQIRAALSQLAEPTDTYTAVDMATAAAQGFRDGQAAVEQAAAQDEREIAELIDQRDNAEDWANKLSDAIASHTGAYIGEHSNMNCPWANALEAIENTRPAQTEQRPVGWFTDDHLTDKSATTYDREVADRWRSKGWPVHELFTAPITQTAKGGE